LKKAEFKSFVRVIVEVAADASFEVTLRTSSGNTEVDDRILDALKQWRWKAALKNGVSVASTQRFKFEIEVQ
jgi:TonB family protein